MQAAIRTQRSIFEVSIANEPHLPQQMHTCVCLCARASTHACALEGARVLTEAMLLVAGVLHFNDKSSMLTRILKRKCSKCHPAVKMRCKQADEKRTKKTK